MARKKKPTDNGLVLFDVIYEDGTRTSNRKVPSADMDVIDGDASARALIEAQDRKIAEMSGKSRGPIKSVTRSLGVLRSPARSTARRHGVEAACGPADVETAGLPPP